MSSGACASSSDFQREESTHHRVWSSSGTIGITWIGQFKICRFSSHVLGANRFRGIG
ncbi:Uncharacterised protein [Mycobacteroides abscessus subsp. abscessus]|nr:Uncharacterised protein [Mycobacteroides abscessus subsp. abscessus]